MKWLDKLRIFVRTGYRLDDDNYKEEATIRYKDIYIQVLKGDHGYSLGWSDNLSPHTSVRELWVAKPPEPVEGKQV